MRRTTAPIGWGLSFALLSAGCGHGKLVPAASATVVPGAPGAAFSLVDGVRCSADMDAWAGRPGDLPDFVTPVKVRITNSSGTPIRLLYEDFVLVGKSGRKYRPVPLLPIDPDPGARRIEPMYASTTFFVASRFHDVYQTLEAWPEPLARNESLYEDQYRRWGNARLPVEVVRMGLPEGVLGDGGVVAGFLFFDNPLGHEDRLTFEAEFDKSDGQDAVAAMRIPFRVQ